MHCSIPFHEWVPRGSPGDRSDGRGGFSRAEPAGAHGASEKELEHVHGSVLPVRDGSVQFRSGKRIRLRSCSQRPRVRYDLRLKGFPAPHSGVRRQVSSMKSGFSRSAARSASVRALARSEGVLFKGTAQGGKGFVRPPALRQRTPLVVGRDAQHAPEVAQCLRRRQGWLPGRGAAQRQHASASSKFARIRSYSFSARLVANPGSACPGQNHGRPETRRSRPPATTHPAGAPLRIVRGQEPLHFDLHRGREFLRLCQAGQGLRFVPNAGRPAIPR